MEDVWKVTSWECPIGRANVDALCQLHEIYVEEKQRCFNNVTNLSKVKNRSSREKGKGRSIPKFKLASNIEQQTNLKKVFKEIILDSRVNFSLQEPLGIAKKEFHDLRINLVKRKKQAMEEPSGSKVSANIILMNDVVTKRYSRLPLNKSAIGQGNH
jgi:hypothetical protein